MKTDIIIKSCLTAISCVMLFGCAQKLESGKEYPILEIGDADVVYELDQVMQNSEDVKPYFSFFDDVKLTLSYKDGKPDKIVFDDSGVPFRVTGADVEYDGVLDVEWEINSASSPYEIRIKGTETVICYMSKDRNITFPFKLGAPSNQYEYRFVIAGQDGEDVEGETSGTSDEQ